MATFFVLLVFGGIGAIFGPVGFVIGIVLGIIGVASSNKNKSKAKPVVSGYDSPQLFTKSSPQGPLIPVPNTSSAQDIWNQKFPQSPPFPTPDKPIAPATSNKQSQQSPQPPVRLSLEEAREYAACVVQLCAAILSFYPNSDSAKVNDVTELLKNDDWITDKFGTLDELAGRLPQVQAERRDSPMMFQLHNNALLERSLRLPKSMKARLAMQLDGFLNGLGDPDPKDCKDLIEKFRLALRQDFPASNERLEAEDFIMRSGDQKAISTLQEMRRNPSRYKEMLRSGATGNTVLKTAFGVFAGMLAADAVRAAVTDYQMKNLQTQLDHDIAKAGGLDSIPLQDKELDSFASGGSEGSFNYSFSGGAEGNSWDDKPSDLSPEDRHADAIEEDDAGFDSDTDNVTEPDLDVADSSTDFSFNFDD